MRIKIFVAKAFSVVIGNQTLNFSEGTHSVMPAIANNYEVKANSVIVGNEPDPAVKANRVSEARTKAEGLIAAAKAEYDQRVAAANALVAAAQNES